MEGWVAAAPALLVAIAFSVGPGIPVALALRIRGFLVLPASIGATFALTGLVSIIAPFLGITWSPTLPFGAGVLVALPCLIGWRWWKQGYRWSVRRSAREWTVPFLALLLAAMIGFATVRAGLLDPAAVSQSYDNIFHLNAVQFVLDTGNSSPFDMTMTSSSSTFYPTLWHAVVSNVALATGVSISLATNAVVLAVHMIIWPVAAMTLARTLFGASINVTLGAGALAGAFSAFPTLLAPWTVLLPNLLATSLLPICIAFSVLALGLVQSATITRTQAFIVAFGTLGACCLAQPNTFFSLGLFLAPAAITAVVRVWRRPIRTWWRFGSSALLIVSALGFLFAWSRVQTAGALADNQTEFDRGGVSGALYDAITNAPLLDSQAWFITLLVLTGIGSAFLAQINRWWTASYLLAVALYVSAAGLPDSSLRTLLTGIWYNDAYRISGLLPVLALPFAAFGFSRLLHLVQRGVRSLDRPRSVSQKAPRRFRLIIASAVFTSIIAAGSQSTSIHEAITAAQWTHDNSTPQASLDDDELELLKQLRSYVPEDALIANNPANGSALAYAFSGRRVLFPHFEGNSDPDAWELASHLKEGGPSVCAAAGRLGADYVLDFGDQYLPAPEYRVVKYPGLTNVGASPILTEIFSVGDARLFEITGCQ